MDTLMYGLFKFERKAIDVQFPGKTTRLKEGPLFLRENVMPGTPRHTGRAGVYFAKR